MFLIKLVERSVGLPIFFSRSAIPFIISHARRRTGGHCIRIPYHFSFRRIDQSVSRFDEVIPFIISQDDLKIAVDTGLRCMDPVFIHTFSLANAQFQGLSMPEYPPEQHHRFEQEMSVDGRF